VGQEVAKEVVEATEEEGTEEVDAMAAEEEDTGESEAMATEEEATEEVETMAEDATEEKEGGSERAPVLSYHDTPVVTSRAGPQEGEE
jgi:hypothetical protein